MDSPHNAELSATPQQEENAAQGMAHDSIQETYWDNGIFSQQSLSVELLENSLFEPLTLTVDSSSPQYIQGLNGETIGLSYSDWGGSIHGDSLPGGNYSPGPPRSNRMSTMPNSNTSNTAGPRRPSAEAIARRRKQNRLSQAAWRARNKELVEELRQEIAEQSEYNETMQETLRSLLKTTESLKGVIENALALPFPKGENAASSAERQLLSPESSTDTTRFDLDAPHDP